MNRSKNSLRFLGATVLAMFLASACTLTPEKKTGSVSGAGKSSAKRGGGYYKDDGPGNDIPERLEDIPDAVPRFEPLHRAASRPYVVFGKTYVPDTRLRSFRQRGVASWYGKKFHGKKTSIGEPYDMFSMTAAHPTLALPSYARVTNLGNGKTVVVRVIDRGPFHAGRIIDLSYAAAHRLAYIEAGSAQVEIETLLPGAAVPPKASAGPVAKPPQPLGESTETAPNAEPSESSTVPVPAEVPESSGPLERPEMWPRPSAERDGERDALGALIARADAREASHATDSVEKESAPWALPPAQEAIFLQLGAFSSADNAENFRSRLAQELDGGMENLRIVAGGGIHRVQLGPYPDREAAEKAARKIQETAGYGPSFVKSAP